jgi:hypothetical protein
MPPKPRRGFPTLTGQIDENRRGEEEFTLIRFEIHRDTHVRSQPAAQSDSDRRARVRRRWAASPAGGWRAPACRAGLGLLCAGVIVASGCSGQSRFLTGGPTVGQLKTSLSHSESENQQLKRSVAQLQQENRSMEDRLSQEQIDNGDLAARLDDARNLLRDRGMDPDVRVGSRRGGGALSGSSGEDDGSSSATSPVSQPARGRRKSPFAQISAPTDPVPPMQEDDDIVPKPAKARDAKAGRSGRRRDDDLDHHSFYSGPLRWLPVADGTDTSALQIR